MRKKTAEHPSPVEIEYTHGHFCLGNLAEISKILNKER